ncbi:MAG: hypothetical protein PHR64_01560 [Candidatus Shapirobacteria bacterium]|nr:hypothetical protein [Candidatus Shapirobacteria bacterium]MDD5481618.1 hypothetical protein [Candidatus Shapirobacteria bacterium]
MVKTATRHQRRQQSRQTKHGAKVVTPDRKIYNQAYQLPKNIHCPKETNRA